MARNSEDLINQLNEAIVKGAAFVLDVADARLIVRHVEWLRREYALVQERFNFEMLALGERLNDMYAIVSSLDSIAPDEPEKFVENKIKQVLRDYAALRQQCEAQKEGKKS